MSKSRLRSDLANHFVHARVTFETASGEPAGFALYGYNYSPAEGRFVYLNYLLVREPYRGKGLAKQLMAELAAVSKEEGLCQIIWAVNEDNTKAREFYERVSSYTRCKYIKGIGIAGCLDRRG